MENENSKTPFFSSLQPLVNKKTRFYVPGHKGNEKAIPAFKEILPYDITEITGADDLSHPQFSLAQSQQNMTKLYGSGATLYSANGSTSCIQAMLNLFVSPNDTIIMARGCHVSAIRALGFIGANVQWIYPAKNVPTPAEVESALVENPKAVAVYLTSPDYEGHIADIKEISTLCHKNNTALLVDNAHGAHLQFLQATNHPISLGADACADSAHKTLPCLTPAALLHIQNASLANQARNSLNLFSSTSPSYLVLQSLDLAAGMLATDPPDFAWAAKEVSKIRDSFPHLSAPTDDPLKILLKPRKAGWQTQEVTSALESAGISPELADDHRIILMASPYNTAEDFTLLAEQLAKFKEQPALPENNLPTFIASNSVCTVRDALFGKKETISVKNSAGRIMGGLFAPCPPGVPLVMPGEKITQDAINIMLNGGVFTIDVIL